MNLLTLLAIPSLVACALAIIAYTWNVSGGGQGEEPYPKPKEQLANPALVNLGWLAAKCDLEAARPGLYPWQVIALRLQAECYRDAQLALMEDPGWYAGDDLDVVFIETAMKAQGERGARWTN